MAITKNGDTATILAYDIGSYTQDVQELVQDGYVLGSDNADYPISFITSFTAGFVKVPMKKARTTKQGSDL